MTKHHALVNLFLRQQTCTGTPKSTEQNLIVRSGKWNLIVV